VTRANPPNDFDDGEDDLLIWPPGHRRLDIVHWAACDVAAIGLRNTIRNEE